MGNIVTMNVIPVSILVPTSFGIGITHTVVNVVILVISFWFVRPSLCRTYAINHSIPSVIYTTFATFIDFTHLSGISRDLFFQGIHPLTDKKMWVNFVQALLLRYTANSYRVFATLMVLLTYISYSHPFLYSRMINKSNTSYIFLAGHGIVALSVCLILPGSIRDIVFNGQLLSNVRNFTAYFLYAEKFFGILCFGIMIVLYILSIYKIVQFSKKQKSTSNLNRKSQLLSVLVYCTPPNIFLLLSIPRSFCIISSSLNLFDDNTTHQDFCIVTRFFHNPLTMIRLFVSSICTLIAFNDYRRIIVAIFARCTLIPSGTTVVPLSNINSSTKWSTRI